MVAPSIPRKTTRNGRAWSEPGRCTPMPATQNVAKSWLWELWNEPDIPYWNGTIEEYAKLYDYTESALHDAIPGRPARRTRSSGPSEHFSSAIPRALRDRHQRRHRKHGHGASTS